MKAEDRTVLYDSDTPLGDVVLSSRVRLARNITGYPFVNRASADQLSEVVHRVQTAQIGGVFETGARWINLQSSDETDRGLLFERNLISKHFSEGTHPRCVALSADGSASIMVNEEDHVRAQMFAGGFRLHSLVESMTQLDRSLEHSLDFAFHPRFGYLTACPTNLGTGIRISVMLHLPALRILDELEKMRRAAKELKLAVRGLHGEGSDALGELFQVSNQVTLGRSEEDLLEEFAGAIVPRLVEYERHARQRMLETDAPAATDRAHRALGILRAARLLSLEEAFKYLSRVRLGIAIGIIDKIQIGTVNRLLLEVQPAHLTRILTLPPSLAADDRAARATHVRTVLA
ncbi:MAG: ATP--guanido phosphotransferase [Phycisphaerales bacterium]|nr:ATP--guanido phosphotransferase [Phycisphaerales bacterium]